MAPRFPAPAISDRETAGPHGTDHEPAARRALEHNLWSLWSRFGRGAGCALHMDDDLSWFETPLRQLPYNAVLRCTVDDEVSPVVDRLVAHFAGRDVPFVWVVHPSARPANIADILERRGMRLAESFAGMARWLDAAPIVPAPPPGIDVVQVSTPAEREALLDLVAWRWQLPAESRILLPGVTRAFGVGAPGSDVRAWLAMREGVPVAKILLHFAAGAAGVYGVVTRPEARGLGIAAHLTQQALRAAWDAGHRLAVLHSTAAALPLYDRLGFRSMESFRFYVAETPGSARAS
jgi:ribosomal protein S18 acetylase RimI-like enzyme